MTRRVEVTREGQMIDQLVQAATGSDEGGTVEAALGLNPGLAGTIAARAHELQTGAIVIAPEAERAPRRLTRIQLWD